MFFPERANEYTPGFLPLIDYYELLHLNFPLSLEKRAIHLGLGLVLGWVDWTRSWKMLARMYRSSGNRQGDSSIEASCIQYLL